jgi:putative toxin-antitoxin system antitoxin component (TIGR02293 family)
MGMHQKSRANKHVEPEPRVDAIVDITARAIEVLGNRDKALRWLKAPVRSLGDRTPLSLLQSPDGIARVEDALGRIEHGVW